MTKLTPRTFEFCPSHLLALCIILGHGVAVCALAYMPPPKIAFDLLLLVLLWSVAYYLLRDARLVLTGAWIGLRIEDDRVVLFNRMGDELSGRLLRSTLVTPHLVILNIKLANFRLTQNVVLMQDSMDAGSFRELRVALKWGINLTA